MDRLYRVHGLVQGVGFRPFVASLANEYGLFGYVKNSGGIVTLRIKGEDKAVEEFIHRLLTLDGRQRDLPGAKVTGLEGLSIEDEGDFAHFSIIESDSANEKIRMLPPDIATCDKCKKELFDADNRRYRHPFISCVSCGPRFSIMHNLPYDRNRTSMAFFSLCEDCKNEYNNTGDRRGYAQTICCNDCGPSLLSAGCENASAKVVDITRGDDALDQTIEVLKAGGVAAIKDIGGYHLAALADNEVAIKRIRKWKNREEKPFAVMFKNIEEIKEVAWVSEREEELLESPERPIVLLESKPSIEVVISPAVTGDSRRIGAMLPCNPLQYLILDRISPLVMTSGNRGGEPIITEDSKMLSLLDTGLPDIILYHDREIVNGLDDSIYQVVEVGNRVHTQIIRRARGLVPLPIFIKTRVERDSFACGGDLKSVFALARESAVYFSGHFGDLYDVRAQKERGYAADTMTSLLGIHPLDYICDKHPSYVSSKYAIEHQAKDTEYYRIQHHHAHGLSVMAEYGIKKAIAVVMDGTGYGDDGNVWGGEFLLCNSYSYARYGHLEMVNLLGGDLGALDCNLSAMAYLIEATKRGLLLESDNPFRDNSRFEYVKAAIDKNINTKPSSSTGRLFDAVSAILDISHYNSYEGQSPIRLENCAEEWAMGRHIREIDTEYMRRNDFVIVQEGGCYILDTVDYIAKLFYDVQHGCDRGMLAYAFHDALAKAISKVLIHLQKDICLNDTPLPVVLSGGCFTNKLLLTLTARRLQDVGIEYYINEKVPCGDGGIALGQIYALAK